MSVAEVKSLIHKLVVETDDINILHQVADFFNTIKVKNADWWDELSEQLKALIEKGKQELENGQGIPHDEVRQEINKILKQKRS